MDFPTKSILIPFEEILIFVKDSTMATSYKQKHPDTEGDNKTGYSNQFQQRYASTDAFTNSFFICTTSDWNKRLSSKVNQPTANTFKTAIQSDPSIKTRVGDSFDLKKNQKNWIYLI